MKIWRYPAALQLPSKSSLSSSTIGDLLKSGAAPGDLLVLRFSNDEIVANSGSVTLASASDFVAAPGDTLTLLWTGKTLVEQSRMTAAGSTAWSATAGEALTIGQTVTMAANGTVATSDDNDTNALGIVLATTDSGSVAPIGLAGNRTALAADVIVAGDRLKAYDGGYLGTMAETIITIGSGVGLAFTNQPANDGLEIGSSSADDVTQSVTVYGTTTGTDTVVAETIALTGTTFVSTVKTDWGAILGYELDAACVGTVTLREASGNATVSTIAAGSLTKGIVEVTDTRAYLHVPEVDCSGASTKILGFKGFLASDPVGTAVYRSKALNGTTAAVVTTAAMFRITRIFVGDVESTRTASVTTSTTTDTAAMFKATATAGVVVGTTYAADARGDTVAVVWAGPSYAEVAARSVTGRAPSTAVAEGALTAGMLVTVASDGEVAVCADNDIFASAIALATVSDDATVGLGESGKQSALAADVVEAGTRLKAYAGGYMGVMVDTQRTIHSTTGAEFTNQPTNDGVEVLSANAGDTTQTATIYYTKGGVATTVLSETKTLNGTTPVSFTDVDIDSVLAVEKSATTLGTVTFREASADQTITTLTAAVLSAGKIACTDNRGFLTVPVIVAGGASTKIVGMIARLGSDISTNVLRGAALNGTTAVAISTAALYRVTHMLTGDVAAATTASIKTSATVDSATLIKGYAKAAAAARGDALSINFTP